MFKMYKWRQQFRMTYKNSVKVNICVDTQQIQQACACDEAVLSLSSEVPLQAGVPHHLSVSYNEATHTVWTVNHSPHPARQLQLDPVTQPSI